MKQLVDIIFIYLSLGAGAVMLWIGIYTGLSPADSLVRALIVGAAVFGLGLLLKLAIVIITLVGGSSGHEEGADGTLEEAVIGGAGVSEETGEGSKRQ